VISQNKPDLPKDFKRVFEGSTDFYQQTGVNYDEEDEDEDEDSEDDDEEEDDISLSVRMDALRRMQQYKAKQAGQLDLQSGIAQKLSLAFPCTTSPRFAINNVSRPCCSCRGIQFRLAAGRIQYDDIPLEVDVREASRKLKKVTKMNHRNSVYQHLEKVETSL